MCNDTLRKMLASKRRRREARTREAGRGRREHVSAHRTGPRAVAPRVLNK